MSWEAKLFSDFGRGNVSRCSVLPSSCRLRSLACNRAIDSSDMFTWSASAARAFTTAFIVLLSLPRSSSRWATKLGFFPILFNLYRVFGELELIDCYNKSVLNFVSYVAIKSKNTFSFEIQNINFQRVISKA